MSFELRWDGVVVDENEPWQGISRLELDGEAPVVLTIHLMQPAEGLLEEHVRVHGPRPLDFSVSFPLEAPSQRAARIELSFPRPGERGIWEVELQPAEGVLLHPFMARASFEFDIEAEGADCRVPSGSGLTRAEPGPAVDLLSKDFTSLVELLSDRAQIINPHWSDLSSAAFERVLIELLAHHGDMLSYYQDRVANEAFLDSATQRFALTQHALLLGHHVGEHLAATTLLAFDVDEPGNIPAGLRVRGPSRKHEARVEFTISETRFLEPRNNSEKLALAQWPGAFDMVVPAGATSVLLWGHHLGLEPGSPVVFVQGNVAMLRTLTTTELIELPGWTDEPSSTPTPKTALATLTRLRWAEGLEHELKVWEGNLPLRVHANLVEARHGRTIRAWLLSNPGAVVAREDPVITLDRSNCNIERVVEDGVERWLLRALHVPGGPVLHDLDAEGEVEPSIELRVDGEGWSRREHLHRSRAFDGHYLVSVDNDGSVWLHFGDGRHGQELELVPGDVGTLVGARPTVDLEISYRIGDPLAGNCGIGRLTEYRQPPASPLPLPAIKSLRNVLPGTGGRLADTLDATRLAAPASLRFGPLERAVTIDDYAQAARQADPRVERAVARELGGAFSTVLVLVDERDSETLGDELRERVSAHLEQLRMVGREVLVRGPQYVALDIELIVTPEPGVALHELRARVYAALRPGSAASPGWLHPDRLSFGQRLELGELLAFVHALPGVLAVKATRFRRLLDPDDAAVIQHIAFAPTQIPRLDADESRPQYGRLRVEVRGLDLDIDPSLDAIATSPEVTP